VKGEFMQTVMKNPETRSIEGMIPGLASAIAVLKT
jgi:hypothetical protein